MNLSIIPNFLQFLIGFAPIFAILILLIQDRFTKKHIYLLSIVCFIVGVYVFVFEPFQYIDYRLSKAFSVYPPFLAILLLMINRKHNAGKTIALSLMLIFLLSELHEIPAFIRVYLGWYDNVQALKHYYTWYTPINHLYSIVVGYLFFKIAKVKCNWKSVGLFSFGVFLSFALYTVRIYRVMTPWEYVIRIFWMPILIALVYFGEE